MNRINRALDWYFRTHGLLLGITLPAIVIAWIIFYVRGLL